MVRVGVYDQIKHAFQDLIAPELHSIRSDIQRLDQKVDGLDARLTGKLEDLDSRLSERIENLDARLTAKVDNLDSRLTIRIDGLRTEMLSMKGELLAEIRRVDTRIDGVDTHLDTLEREVRTAMDVRERLAALEARRQ